MDLDHAYALLGACLERLELSPASFEEHGAYATVDEAGHQLLMQVRQGPWLADDALEPANLVYVGTTLLADAGGQPPDVWEIIARLNHTLAFGKFFFNAEEGHIGVGVELFADELTPRQLGVALRVVSNAANEMGDLFAEHFEGRRVFWRHGRT